MSAPRIIDLRGTVATHGRQDPTRIILHCTQSGNIAGISDITGVALFWRRQGKGYGATYIADAEGNIGRCALPTQVTWHTYMKNSGSVGIELIGFARYRRLDWLNPRRRRQLKRVAWLCAKLCHTYGIRPHHDLEHGIAMHRDYPAGGHTDPGAGFAELLPWLLRQVRAELKGM